MKGRKQKKSQDTLQQNDRAELDSYVGGQTFMWITENNCINNGLRSDYLLEQILSPSNLNQAYKQVKSNKGASGVDKIEVESLQDYLISHKDELITSILKGKYRPNPVRRVEIPKDNGQKRQLGIPTVVDRVVQQAIAQILSSIYEPQFSPSSYGFRPNRSAHQALAKCKEYAQEGYKYSVDLDLERFFDTVQHSKLIEVLSRTIRDGRVISLIHSYLNAGVMINGQYESTSIGVPQGGPLSPLLSNIMLNELDKELTNRGHYFVRYADDVLILCRSKRSARRTQTSIITFIEDKLFLLVNREKTHVCHVKDVKFLGYSFYTSSKGLLLRVHPKSLSKMRLKMKSLTQRSNGLSNETRKEKLNAFIRGWVNYFKLADMKSMLKGIDEWFRRRIRMVIWKQWKRIKTRCRNLVKLGVPHNKALEYANTRKSYWHTANSPILSTSITNDRLRSAGYIFFSEYYHKIRL